MSGKVMRLQKPKRRRSRVPLRVGDIWILVGPQTPVQITGLAPRPTFQKAYAQAVTLHDGRTLAESTFRGSYLRQQEYETVFLPVLRSKLRALFPERCEVAVVIPFRKATA